MATALFSFADQAAASQAAQRLLSQGLPPDAVKLCGPQLERASRDTDELLTGGFLHNLSELLEGLAEWGTPGQDQSAYSDVVERGGAVVRVEADTAEEQARADAAMSDATRSTGWH
jgi:hypothetical protein